MPWPAVLDVLSFCADAEVALSVVQAVTVYMINDHAFGGAGDIAVHEDFFLFIAYAYIGIGVKVVSILAGVPFVFFQALVIVGIDDSEFAV